MQSLEIDEMVGKQSGNGDQDRGHFFQEKGFAVVDTDGHKAWNGKDQDVPTEDVQVDVTDSTKVVSVLL